MTCFYDELSKIISFLEMVKLSNLILRAIYISSEKTLYFRIRKKMEKKYDDMRS